MPFVTSLTPGNAPQFALRKPVMSKIRRLVLDTLKPHEPTIIEWASLLSEPDGISSVNISIYEIDHKVENAKVTIEGEDISYGKVRQLIQDMGGTIHSIDEVVAGRDIIDDAATLQD
jgi:hypothetical protein